MKKAIMFLFIGLSLLGCLSENGNVIVNPPIEEWNKILKVEEFLTSLNFNVEVEESIEGGVCYEVVKFLGDSIFLDQYSNELLLKTIVFSEINSIKQFDSIIIQFEFEKFHETAQFNLDQDKINLIETFFEDVSYFEDVVHSFKSFNYNTVVFFDSLIKVILEARDNDIDHPSNYWEYLRYLSEFSNGRNEYLKEAHVYITLIQLLKHEKFEGLSSRLFEKFENILTRHSIDLDVLDMPKQDVIIYLQNYPLQRR